MKNSLLFCFIILCFSSTYAQTPSVKEDEEAIKKVIISEFDAYVARDFKTWADTYVDAPSTTFMVTDANTPGSLFVLSDFQKISKGMKGMFDSGSKSNMSLANRDGWIIRIKGDMAFAIYNEEFLMANGTKIKAKTQKVMERINGQWKIATTAVIGDYNNAVIPTPNPDEEVIKKALNNETLTFHTNPQETFSKHWVLNNSTFLMGTWNNGKFTHFDSAKLKEVAKDLKPSDNKTEKTIIKST